MEPESVSMIQNPFVQKSITDMYKSGKFKFLRDRKPGVAREHHLITTERECDLAMARLLKEMGQTNIIGYDQEGITYVNYKHEVKRNAPEVRDLGPVVMNNVRSERTALIQLSTISGYIVLVRLCFFTRVPESLREILTDASIYKVGVGIGDDAESLYASWYVRLVGWVDLRFLSYELPQEVITIQHENLKDLAVAFFSEEVFPFYGQRFYREKVKGISWSFWAPNQLSNDQLTYAIFDGQVAADIVGVVLEYLTGRSLSPDGQMSQEQLDDFRGKLSPFLSLVYDTSTGESKKGKKHYVLHTCPYEIDDHITPHTKEYEEFMHYLMLLNKELTGVRLRFSSFFGDRESNKRLLLQNSGRLPILVRRASRFLCDPGTDEFESESVAPGGCWAAIADKLTERNKPKPDNELMRLNLKRLFDYREMVEQVPGGQIIKGIVPYDSGSYSPLAIFIEIETVESSNTRYRKAADHTKTKECDASADQQDAKSAEKETGAQSAAKRRSPFDKYLKHQSLAGSAQKPKGVSDKSNDMTVRPCCICGESRAQHLLWERIVPRSYESVYLWEVECLHNYIKLCRRCILLWRLGQHECSLELALVCKAPLDSPRWATRPYFRTANKVLRKLLGHLYSFSQVKAKSRLAISCDQETAMFDFLRQFCMHYKHLVSFDVNHQSNLKKSIAELRNTAASLTRFYVCPTVCWSHEGKVLTTLGNNPVILERIFRRRLLDMCRDKRFLPNNWCTDHLCWSDRDSFSTRWQPPEGTDTVTLAEAEKILLNR